MPTLPPIIAPLLKALPRGLLLAAAIALGGGCFFDNPEASGGGGSWDDFPNPEANQCGDITPAQMKTADSLVKDAGPVLTQEAEFFLGEGLGSWKAVKSRDLPALKDRYGTAVKAAPNHCGALFGHGMATAASVLNDRLLDSLVRSAGGTGDYFEAGSLAKVDKDGGAAALFKLRRSLSRADKELFTLGREVIETVLLPNLDISIRSLEAVARNPDFNFDIGYDDSLVRIDRGEVAPLLGGLKVFKAALYLIAGYEWQPEPDESLPYLEVIREIGEDDLDSLTAGQKEALDHYTSLLKSGAPFSRIRAGWKDRVGSIPSLLLEAVNHAQDGLRHGIAQAEKKQDQRHDPYIVGTGEDADVDPADLERGVEALELAKKYLKGVVPIAYNNGRNTLRVDFPKLFRIDGMQGLLPHFAYLPYPAWNDRVARRLDTLAVWGDSVLVDTVYSARGPIQFLDGPGGKPTLEAWQLEDYADSASRLTGRIVFPDPTFGGILPGLTNANIWVTVENLLKEEAGTRRECVADSLGGETCVLTVPKDPSDLDKFLEIFLDIP